MACFTVEYCDDECSNDKLELYRHSSLCLVMMIASVSKKGLYNVKYMGLEFLIFTVSVGWS